MRLGVDSRTNMPYPIIVGVINLANGERKNPVSFPIGSDVETNYLNR